MEKSLEERRRRLREREDLELAAMEAGAAKALQQKVGHFCTSKQVFLYQQGKYLGWS